MHSHTRPAYSGAASITAFALSSNCPAGNPVFLFRASHITGEVRFYYSKDSTRVPVIVVHRKDVKMDGNNPVLLTAYGGFNIGISPGFYGYYAPFINRGGIVAPAGRSVPPAHAATSCPTAR